MIARRALIGAMAGSVTAAPLASHAQPSPKVWRIGYLGNATAGSSPDSDRTFAAFVQGLKDNGLVEGTNMVLERRAMAGRMDQAPALIAELISLHVDVLVVVSPAAAHAAKQATATIPIVVTLGSDPVAGGLVASLARPGGNITGLTDFGDELNPKRLELLKTAAPRTARVAFIEPDYAGRFDAAQLVARNQEYDVSARGLGISLIRVPLKSARDLEAASAAMIRERADAMIVDDGAITYLLRREIADFAIRQRLPAIVAHRSALAGGFLMSYGPDLADNFRKAATYVARIRNGVKPADLPIERPTKLELLINLKTARAIGLTVPQSLLLRADEVIK